MLVSSIGYSGYSGAGGSLAPSSHVTVCSSVLISVTLPPSQPT